MKSKEKKTSKVGKAVYDILSKPQESQEVGETVDAMGPRYFDELFDTISANRDRLPSPFFIVVLRKKEPWALNVLRQWFVARETRPSAKFLRHEFPNHDHDVWLINTKDEKFQLLWTLPTAKDSLTIIKNAECYHPDLIKWIQSYNEGKEL